MTLRRYWLAILLAITSTTLIQAQRSDDDAAIKRGNELVAQAKYESAIREYERVTPATDLYARALYNIGVCQYELWRTDLAIDYYSRATAATRNNYPRASYALGVALEDRGRFGEAREAYQQAINRSRGEFAAAQFRLGLLIARDGDYPEAGHLFRQAIRKSGEHLPASHNNLGVILAWTGHLKEAEAEFKIALRLSGGDFKDAARNLKVCRTLLAGETNSVALSLADDLSLVAN